MEQTAAKVLLCDLVIEVVAVQRLRRLPHGCAVLCVEGWWNDKTTTRSTVRPPGAERDTHARKPTRADTDTPISSGAVFCDYSQQTGKHKPPQKKTKEQKARMAMHECMPRSNESAIATTTMFAVRESI